MQHSSPVSYPDSWQVREAGIDGQCPSIEGVYKNEGEASQPDPDYKTTIDGSVFARPPISGVAKYVSLSIEKTDSEIKSLKVEYSGEYLDPVDQTNSFIVENISCENGLVEWIRSSAGYVDGTSTDAVEWITIGLSNDFLIVRYQFSVSSSSLLVFRGTSRGDVWYRFLSVK